MFQKYCPAKLRPLKAVLGVVLVHFPHRFRLEPLRDQRVWVNTLTFLDTPKTWTSPVDPNTLGKHRIAVNHDHRKVKVAVVMKHCGRLWMQLLVTYFIFLADWSGMVLLDCRGRCSLCYFGELSRKILLLRSGTLVGKTWKKKNECAYSICRSVFDALRALPWRKSQCSITTESGIPQNTLSTSNAYRVLLFESLCLPSLIVVLCFVSNQNNTSGS